MCGIGGFLGGFSPELLERMNTAMAHRGPDDCGTFFDADAGLGLAHRRLSIIDLRECGRQPMWDVTHTVAIVYNGELYNYRELRAELSGAGYEFATDTDTEVLLNLYRRDGEGMLAKLNGMFAFAIWDTRTQTLFVARDGMGVKPLYYAQTPHGFVFASEMKALLQEPSLDRSVSADALRYHLTYLWCPAPHTILSAVRKMEPGQAMLVRRRGIERSWRFWSLSYPATPEEMPVGQAIRDVRDAVRTAVGRQMVADVPVGAFLSGGLDSSAVVAFAREHSPERLQCFTIALDRVSEGEEGTTRDLPYAKSVARHLDVDLHIVHVGPEAAESLPEMLYSLEEPQADPATLNVLFICRLARQRGIKVLLSGAGGDDVFGGYRRHYGLSLEPYWQWLPKSLRGALASAAGHMPARPEPVRRAAKALQYADLEGDARLASYFHWLPPRLVDSLLSHDMRAAGSGVTPLMATLAELPEGVPPLNRMLYLEARHFLADHNLIYTDKMSMASSVEVRVPLLDPDVVALASRLPVSYKQRGTQGKWIFKKAMEGILPREVIYRPKTGFGAPLRAWLRGPLRPLLEEHLSTAALRRRGWFDPGAVQQLMHADRVGRIDAGYPIFAVLCAELWAQAFLDRPLAAQPVTRRRIEVSTPRVRQSAQRASRHAPISVGIDLMPAARRIGGGWHYARNLLRALAEHDSENRYLIFANPESVELVPEADNFDAVEVWTRTGSRAMKVAFESVLISPVAAGHHLDCMHYLFGTLPLWSPTPSVVTIHDLKTEERPWDAPPVRRAYIRPARRRAARRASLIAAVSQATAEDLHDILGVPWDRIEVVPSAMGSEFVPRDQESVDSFRRRYRLPPRFWLYVANVRPHKNHERLLIAHRELRQAYPGTWPLVLAGDSPDAFRRLLARGDEPHVHLLPRLPDFEMPLLYSAASGLVFPSLFEGGGMPVMEAMACGCPVAASDIPTTREFAGSAALQFDPRSAHAIQRSMHAIQESESLRAELRAAGIVAAQAVSPLAAATAMMRAYARVRFTGTFKFDPGAQPAATPASTHRRAGEEAVADPTRPAGAAVE